MDLSTIARHNAQNYDFEASISGYEHLAAALFFSFWLVAVAVVPDTVRRGTQVVSGRLPGGGNLGPQSMNEAMRLWVVGAHQDWLEVAWGFSGWCPEFLHVPW